MKPKPKWRRLIIIGTGTLCAASALAALALHHYSFESRFHRSKPALEAYATTAMTSDPSHPLPPPPPRLGAFQTGTAHRLPHGFFLYCNYGNPFDANGIAYSTIPLPHDFQNQRLFFTHIEGNWYTVWVSNPDTER